MKRLQAYLNMIEILKENKNNRNIDLFIEMANPFTLDNEYSIATLFINEYEEYFLTHEETNEEIYNFILRHLNKYDKYELHVRDTFLKTSRERFVQLQECTSM